LFTADIVGFNVDKIVRDIQEAIERERMAEHNVGWNVILFPTPAIRRMLIVGVATAVSQQAVGIDAIQYYLMDILEESGIENQKSRLGVLMLLGMVKLVFIFVGGYYFDKHGRRPLFFISLVGTYDSGFESWHIQEYCRHY
jgi:Sugar (and other) transporter